LTENVRVRVVPSTVTVSVPCSVFPFAFRGDVKRQAASPLATCVFPCSFVPPTVAVQVTAVGRVGAPRAVTWTVAETTEPVWTTVGAVTATFGGAVGTTT